MDRVVDRINNGYRLCVTGDQNGWVEGRIMMTITGAFGIHSENDNKKRVTGFYAEKGVVLG